MSPRVCLHFLLVGHVRVSPNSIQMSFNSHCNSLSLSPAKAISSDSVTVHALEKSVYLRWPEKPARRFLCSGGGVKGVMGLLERQVCASVPLSSAGSTWGRQAP